MGSYWGTSGNDILYGGDSNDSLYGGDGNDSLDGGNGDDSLYGRNYNYNSSAYEADGNDTLNGGAGNDTFIDWVGNDTFIGGEGSDRFVYTTNSVYYAFSSTTPFDGEAFGVDVISDFETDIDKIVLDKNTFTSISSAVGTGFSSDTEFAIVATDDEAATSTAYLVYNSVNGNLFYNSNGSASGLGTGGLFITLAGAPTLVATDFMINASPLTKFGGDGNDTIVGGDGNDTIVGGDGNDTIVGADGSDRFVYHNAFNYIGVDVISDFETGNDKIVLDPRDFTSISSTIGTGFSVSEEFAVVTCDAQAAISSADIVYNSVNGNLFYNPNGSGTGFGTGGLFITLAGVPTLAATDFMISQISFSDV